jgi:hypothetical protein
MDITLPSLRNQLRLDACRRPTCRATSKSTQKIDQTWLLPLIVLRRKSIQALLRRGERLVTLAFCALAVDARNTMLEATPTSNIDLLKKNERMMSWKEMKKSKKSY